MYRAEALVLIDSQKIPEKFVSSTVSSGVADRLAAISQAIMSTTRLLKIIHDLDLYSDERNTKTQEELVEQMHRAITVNVQKDNWATGKPVAFKVGFESRSRGVVAEVANRVANLYIQENLQTRELEASGTSTFIDSQVAEAKHELDEQEAKVAHFKQQHNGSLPEQESSLLANVGNLRVQLQGIQDSINRSQQNRSMLETALSTEQSSTSNLEERAHLRSSGAGPTTSAYAPEDQRLTLLQQELKRLELRYTPDHPDVIAVKAEIAKIQQDLPAHPPRTSGSDSSKSSTGAHVETGLPLSPEVLQARGKIAMLKAQIASVEREISFEEGERARIVAQINASDSKIGQLPLVEQQMAGLTRDYETDKANYKSLLDKKIAAQMASDMEVRQKSERFEVIDPARVPEKPFKPNRQLWVGVAVALSLAISLLAGFGLELRQHVLLGEWELPPNVVVLGRVPVINMNAEPSGEYARLVKPALIGGTAVLLIGAGLAYYVLRAKF